MELQTKKDPITPDRFLDLKGLSGNTLNAEGVKRLLEEYADLKCARMLEEAADELPNAEEAEGKIDGILSELETTIWHHAYNMFVKLVSPVLAKKNEKIIEYLRSKNYLVYADTNINTIFVDSKMWLNR